MASSQKEGMLELIVKGKIGVGIMKREGES